MTRFASTYAPPFPSGLKSCRKDLQPLLGTDLLELESAHSRSELVSCGSLEIDGLLGGGFERGCVIGASSAGVEGRILSLNLLASVILPYIDALALSTKVIVIDTTGNFPLPLLDSILRSRINQYLLDCPLNQDQTYHSLTTRAEINNKVHCCLQMVSICRVFDIEGLLEVIQELRKGESDLNNTRRPSKSVPMDEDPGNEKNELEIMDSDLELTALYESSPTLKRRTSVVVGSPVQPKTNDKGVEMVIIDNMTTLASDLLTRKEKSEAHDELEILSQELHALTSQSGILTFLHNTTVSSKPAYGSKNVPALTTSKPASIFLSNPLKPALGQIFAQLLCLHLFLSPLPRSVDDVKVIDSIEGSTRKASLMTDITYTTVVEVLKDDSPKSCVGKGVGWREKRWTAVDIDEAGTALVCAIPNRLVEVENLAN